MSDSPSTALLSLAQRVRNIIWRQRIIASLWYGCLIAAITLSLLALVHVAVAAVPVVLWLPCLLVPPALSALRSALWHRPSCAESTAELDRLGGYDELLVSAWDVLETPPRARPASAGIVLRQASAVCQDIQLSPVRTALSPWGRRYGQLPPILLLVTLFLFQLPTARLPEEPQLHKPASGLLQGYYPPQASATIRPTQDPATAAGPAASARTEPGPGTPISPASKPSETGQLAGETEASDSAGQVESAVAGQEAAPVRSGKELGAAPGARREDSLGAAAEATFAEIARGNPGAAQRTIAGTGGSGLIAAQPAQTDPTGVHSAGVAAQHAPAHYANRFSLPQRLQIRAYLERLEDTP